VDIAHAKSIPVLTEMKDAFATIFCGARKSLGRRDLASPIKPKSFLPQQNISPSTVNPQAPFSPIETLSKRRSLRIGIGIELFLVEPSPNWP
jgi:hypothetical protein